MAATGSRTTAAAGAVASLDEFLPDFRGTFVSLFDVLLVLTVHCLQAGLIVVQTASVLLDVLSLAFPLHPNYTPSASLANLHPPPTFFGTTTSPAGYVVLSILVALRWLWLFKISAGPFSVLPRVGLLNADSPLFSILRRSQWSSTSRYRQQDLAHASPPAQRDAHSVDRPPHARIDLFAPRFPPRGRRHRLPTLDQPLSQRLSDFDTRQRHPLPPDEFVEHDCRS